MRKKSIDLRRVNEHCANEKIRKAVQAKGIEEVDEGSLSLVKVALKYKPTGKNTPFYAFYKPLGKKKAALYQITTGDVRIVSIASISKMDEVKGTFTIGGVTYGPKDTINGLRRFGQYK